MLQVIGVGEVPCAYCGGTGWKPWGPKQHPRRLDDDDDNNDPVCPSCHGKKVNTVFYMKETTPTKSKET